MKIAIVRLSALGDIVFSAVCHALIKQKYKNAHITWIVDSRFEGVIADSPFVDEVVAISLKPLTLQNIAADFGV
jgi:heptosyltransferase-1